LARALGDAVGGLGASHDPGAFQRRNELVERRRLFHNEGRLGGAHGGDGKFERGFDFVAIAGRRKKFGAGEDRLGDLAQISPGLGENAGHAVDEGGGRVVTDETLAKLKGEVDGRRRDARKGCRARFPRPACRPRRE